MSKAFLRESDQADEPEVPALVSPLPPGTRNYLTAAGADRLRAELRRLRTEERPVIATRAANDPAAKPQLTALDQRVRYLQQSLFGAEIVTVTPGPADAVRFGSTVDVRDADGHPARYRIVGVDEADPDHGEISWVAPLAKALMHATVGDRVRFSTPTAVTELTVLGIRYE